MAPTLPEKVLAVDGALRTVDHAFGGALSLAYYAEARATVDIDLNVFVAQSDAEATLEPLRALGAVATEHDAELIRRDGQARIHWAGTPIDLFYSYDPFHDAAQVSTRRVPFADSTIPILSADHLTVCKVVFDRPKDWVDIDAMREAGTVLDAAEIARWVGRIVGDADPRYRRILAVLTT